MSEDSKPHSRLRSLIVECRFRYETTPSVPVLALCDEAERLIEQYEDVRDKWVTLDAEYDRLKEQLEAANERLSQYEEPGYITAVQKVQQLKEQNETLLDLLRVSVGFWIATPQEFIDAQHKVPNRDKVKQIAELLSNPAISPDDPPGAGWHEHTLCVCGGYEAGDHHFDRSLCACGVMHYYCNRCGSQGDSCDPDPAKERS